MRVQPITTAAEARAERVLRRSLSGTGWTVALKLPIQVVLNREAVRLTSEEFSLYTRGHFDFTVYDEDNHEPAFVVEFDAFGHDKPRQIARDMIKNRLCAKADLPLLRIGIEHVTAEGQLSVLAWIADLFLSLLSDDETADDEGVNPYAHDAPADAETPWLDPDTVVEKVRAHAATLKAAGYRFFWPTGRDGKQIVPRFMTVDLRARRAWISSQSPGYTPGEDGGAFERSHAFPANTRLARRLLDDFGMSVGREVEGFESSWETAPYRFEIDWPGRQPTPYESGSVSEFVVSERDFRIYARSQPEEHLLKSVGRSRFAWAHRIEAQSPAPGASTINRRSGLVPLDLWFEPWGVATELALHHALSQAHRWAIGRPGRQKTG